MKQNNKQDKNDAFSFDIDYEMFTTEEIIKIINFYQDVIKYTKRRITKDALKASYKEYKNIINSIALEKQYDKKFFEKTNISIYKVIKSLDN